MTAYYNEIDPKAAAWLRELIERGLIARGDVDERSIQDVKADDLAGYTQCHFFAGIGGWSVALRKAGWDDDRPVWTGSCPCQPFSVSGAGEGYSDDRHLAPVWLGLIAQLRPATIFGEQVASKDGRDWLAVVRSEMEKLGYVVGAADLCAAGVGAPHIRQRLWFGAHGVADDTDTERWAVSGDRGSVGHGSEQGRQEAQRGAGACGEVRELGDQQERGRGVLGDATQPRRGGHPDGTGDTSGGVAHGPSTDASPEREQCGGKLGQQPHDGGVEFVADEPGKRRHRATTTAEQNGRPVTETGRGDNRPGADHGGWGVADWLHCQDGKWRPVEPGTFPLDHGIPARLGRLRGYGNAIVPQVAKEFVMAFNAAVSEMKQGAENER